ncbi:dentin sialophosphoprotein-like, partial [Trifolium medium]|nr:dentin sialophosphoprotein-like [Trifolium medium]
NDRLEDNSSGHEKTQSASSELHVEVKNETRSEKSEDINQHNVTADELPAVIPNFADQNGPTTAEFPVNPNFSPDIGSEKGVTGSGLFHERDIDNHILADSEMLHQDNVESPDSNYQLASEDTLPNEASRLD